MGEEKKENRGGARTGAGRTKLPVGDKKVQVKFWIESKHIFQYGGLKRAAEIAKETLIKGNNPISEISIQDLTKPTNEIKAITNPKPQSNVVHNTLPVTPLISPYNGFREEIKKATLPTQLDEIMSRVKAAAMIPREKQMLEAYAKELSREMYTD